MLDDDAIRGLVGDMWRLHESESTWLDRIYEFVTGQRGAPEIPEGAEQEVKDLARLSIKNVLGLVRDSFTQNLSVVGYRDALAVEDDKAWRIWQRNRMDARQAEVYRPAITYGAAFVVVTAGPDGSIWRTRSPRQLLAVFEDAQTDVWPQFAFETWIDQSQAKPRRKGMLYDEQFCYPLDMGGLPSIPVDPNATKYAQANAIQSIGEPYQHGAAVCPVVRFINARDADDLIVGEVAPLLRLQQAINEVNFDRLIVSRFGAFPQKVIAGWTGTPTEVLAASARRVWAFDDPEVKTSSFPAASMDGYNAVLEEMMEHLAMVAQISPAQVTGKMINVSAEALAASEANQQRKLQAKRDSFGESWEQVFALAAEIDGIGAADTEAEVLWRDTEARTFAAIVDGVVKLGQAGIPVEEMLDFIPGMEQQRIQAIRDRLRLNQANQLVAALTALPQQQQPQVQTPMGEMPTQRPSPANMPGALKNGMVTR